MQEATKKIGIWMDHSNAYLIAFSTDVIDTENIDSEFTHQEKQHSLSKSEHLMHNKAQQQQGEYYKKLGAVIQKYDEVLLLDPTNAKSELFDLLKADHHFDKIVIWVEQTDDFTESQRRAFVRGYFSK